MPAKTSESQKESAARKTPVHRTAREPHDAVYELAKFMGLHGVTDALAGKLLHAGPKLGRVQLDRLEFAGRVVLSRPGCYVADIYAPLGE